MAHADTQDLVGKTVKHSWSKGPFPEGMPAPTFQTLFCSADTLVWNNITDPAAVTASQETYAHAEVAPGVVQISWKESPETTNFGLIWTLNFNTNEIFGVIVNADPNMNMNVSGNFEVVDGLEVGAGMNGC